MTIKDAIAILEYRGIKVHSAEVSRQHALVDPQGTDENGVLGAGSVLGQFDDQAVITLVDVLRANTEDEAYLEGVKRDLTKAQKELAEACAEIAMQNAKMSAMRRDFTEIALKAKKYWL